MLRMKLGLAGILLAIFGLAACGGGSRGSDVTGCSVPEGVAVNPAPDGSSWESGCSGDIGGCNA